MVPHWCRGLAGWSGGRAVKLHMKIRYGQGRKISRTAETVDPVEMVKFKVQGSKLGCAQQELGRICGWDNGPGAGLKI